MTYIFRYSLSLILLALIHARRKGHTGIKHRRDISDLQNDPLLTSIFSSDLQEKRRDRSISQKEEKEENKSDDLKQQELLRKMLLSTKELYRRDTSPYDKMLNTSSLPEPDPYYANFASPIIGGQVPVPGASNLTPELSQAITAESPAVVPKLFAANFLPLQNQPVTPNLPVASPINEEASKRYSIPYASSPTEASKRDSIPFPNSPSFSGVKKELVSQSIPLQLRKWSPNKQLRGIVPHTSEYGETVDSVEQAQMVMGIKKSMMPIVSQMAAEASPSPMYPINFAPVSQSMYSKDVIKKNDIPTPPPSVVDDAPKISAPVPVNVAPIESEPVSLQTSASLEASPTGAVMEAAKGEKKSNVAPQVQNLDGTYTRPIITDEECADQYASCVDFAKNEYCTKYYDLMKIQCRRSCAFCAVPDKPDKKKKEEISAPSNSSAAVTPKDSKKSSTGKPVKSDAHKKSTAAAKKKGGEAKKDTVSSKNTKEKSKKSDVSKKSTEPSHKVVSKKSETSKKHTSDSSTKSKVETKSKSIKEEKKEKAEPEKKSKVSDTESGSTSESDSSESGSGDLASGDAGSGSGSGSGDDGPATVAVLKHEAEPKEEKKEPKEEKSAKKSISKKSHIPSKSEPEKDGKSDLGEFTLPVAKSEVSTASVNERSENEESGSGSASGDEVDDDDNEVVPDKKTDIGKPKSGEKATAKKSEATDKIATDKKATDKKAPSKPAKKAKVYIKIKKSKEPEKPSKPKKIVKKRLIAKKNIVPAAPKKLTSYPRIDLRLIASALAHYEEAALQLAGEYPKLAASPNEVTRSTIPKPEPVKPAPAPVERSEIPHPHHLESAPRPLPSYQTYQTKKELIIDPLDKYKQNLEIAKLLTDDRNGRSTIPKYLKLTNDVKTEEAEKPTEYEADSLSSIQKRFNILGIEPTLIDYYAETGKINPFSQKYKKKGYFKKSNIAKNSDPYEYLRNMPAGASMLPIDDPKARSKIPSDHSYPVFLMKVSPGDRKYVEEKPMRRGEIRHLNAEGVRISDNGGLPRDIVQKLDKPKAAPATKPAPPVRKAQQPAAPAVPAAPAPPSAPAAAAAAAAINQFAAPGVSMYQNPLYQNLESMAAANMQNYLLQVQNNLAAQTKTIVPKVPPPAIKTAVPRPATQATAPQVTPAAIKSALEKSRIANANQYAQNQMKLNAARAKAEQTARSQTARINAIHKQQELARAQAQQRSQIKAELDIAQATAPQVNPALVGEVDVDSLKNKMVSAFFPMKKDGIVAEGSGDISARG